MSSGALEGRIDAIYYSASNTLEIIGKTIYQVKKLSKIAEMQRGRFSHRPRNEPKFYGGEYPFIQTGDVVRASNEGGAITFSQTLNELGLGVSKLFQPKIIVITIAANIGDTAILTYPACFPDSLVAITPKTDEVNIDYLNIYLTYLKPYLENLAPQSAQKNINLQQLAPTPIIIPPLPTQAQIVEKFNLAYQNKQAKEQQARVLLAGIDAYLLEKLGIDVPLLEEVEHLNKKSFFVNFAQVQGGRFDPFYHQKSFEVLERSLEGGKYPLQKLGKVIRFIGSGSTPKAGGDDYTDAISGVPFIRVTNLKNNSIDFEDTLFIRREIHEKLLKRTQLKEGDVLLSMAGTIGLSIVVPEISEANINQAIAKIETKEIINNYYLSEFLNSVLGKKQTKHLSRPAVQSNINLDEIQIIKIPLPPLSVQNEIAEHISGVRRQAKELEAEARAEIEQAKAEVERLILGE